MAQVNKGSFKCTGGYQGRTLLFSWSIKEQSIENNTTTISWTLEGDGTAPSGWYSSDRFTVKINGVTVYSSGDLSPRLELRDGTVVKTGTHVLNHNSDGTCTFTASAQGAIFYGSVNTTGSGSWEVTQIARMALITSASNFTDEGDYPTLSYNNAAGNMVTSLQACIANETGGTVYVPYRDIAIDGTSYTFELTEAELTTLRNACVDSNSMTIRYYIKTEISGNTLYSNVAKTFTVVNASPIITAAVYDGGSVSTTLTGDNSKMIKGFNSMHASMEITLQKGATLASQKIVNGSVTKNSNSAIFGYTENNTFTFSVTDSRGNTTTKTIKVDMVDYIELTCNLVVESFSAEGVANLNVRGNYYNGSFGAQNNELTIQYRYKPNDEDYSAWADIENTVTGNTYSAIAEIPGFDYRKSYTFQCRAIDKINKTGINSEEAKVKIFPVFDWGENEFSFNIPVAGLSINGMTLLDLIHPIGSVYISRSAVSPADIFGGTWRRIEDKFILAAGTTYASGSTGGAATHTLTVDEMPSHNHSVTATSATTSGSASALEHYGTKTADRSFTTGSKGGGKAHNNMPPYLALYVWERIRDDEIE